MVRLLSRLSNFGLPNLVAGKSIVPELIQNGAAPEAVAREALAIMEDPARRQLMVAELGKVRSLLGDGGATERAARRILDLF
jgi:lipid-A-disaccharide synthase